MGAESAWTSTISPFLAGLFLMALAVVADAATIHTGDVLATVDSGFAEIDPTDGTSDLPSGIPIPPAWRFPQP